ncbi:FmdB family zinc ribbon protein [Spiribacter vilamensis]|uniref:Putative FmdB family regulatory protein n=1 Tax=Spiribacter vilamensis TaxID=531306 RepID=A0A4Q8D1E3_9GAMM|nr:zinc ribbon domain-containing protein [Spiribacter vilamensis]RZU99124.1 putative FmdB family regulatory protein [Spiribacter vilamensis]TVO61880.1 zinc ribbon domain-containing protein [Spiribacter vilamensis]
MPIYEYVCDDCGHELEALQGMSDAMLTDCPDCGHAALRRKISAAAFRLKGSGWYETDFKKENRRNIAGDQSSGSNDASKDNSKGTGKAAGNANASGKGEGGGKASGQASGKQASNTKDS